MIKPHKAASLSLLHTLKRHMQNWHTTPAWKEAEVSFFYLFLNIFKCRGKKSLCLFFSTAKKIHFYILQGHIATCDHHSLETFFLFIFPHVLLPFQHWQHYALPTWAKSVWWPNIIHWTVLSGCKLTWLVFFFPPQDIAEIAFFSWLEPRSENFTACCGAWFQAKKKRKIDPAVSWTKSRYHVC